MKVACWNVRSLLDKELSERQHRRNALLARKLSLYDIDITGLSETSLADVGQLTETGSGYTFFWKGKPADEAREHCVCFAIKSSLSKNLQVNQSVLFLYIPLCDKNVLSQSCQFMLQPWSLLKQTYSLFMMS